jgi:hypothetical protein
VAKVTSLLVTVPVEVVSRLQVKLPTSKQRIICRHRLLLNNSQQLSRVKAVFHPVAEVKSLSERSFAS